MNTESVIEFLGNVPLLMRLPSSSLKSIAELVVLKRYEKGDFVVREDQDVEGVYILLEGEAQVLGSDGEENSSEFLLKRSDFFGYGIFGSVYSADVIAVSELTCLLLPHDHCALLKKESIFDSNKEPETCSLVERILDLETLDFNIFRGITLPDAPTFGKVYGGQFVGQALAAATKTVDSLKIVHSLHSYFLRVGDLGIPIVYEVHRLRDGKNFCTRRVEARQQGRSLFTLFASFQTEQERFTHQESTIPPVLPPESLIPREEMHERRLTDPRLPRDYRNKVATQEFAQWPVDIRFCEPNYSTEQTNSPPRLKYWFRVKGKLSDDQALHRSALAYVSDFLFASISMLPHLKKGLTASSLSLDHSIWFHRAVKADDWLLFVIVSPIAYQSRGFAKGEMFNRKGELVVSLTQEALLKESVTPKRTFGAKL